MSMVEIKEAVQKLTLAEMEELTRWMNAQRERAEEADAQAWDKQIEEDVKAGRLNHLIAEARADIKAGRSKPLLVSVACS